MPSRAICLSAQQWAVPLRIKTYCFVFSGPQTPAPRSTVHLSRSPAEGFPILGLKRCHLPPVEWVPRVLQVPSLARQRFFYKRSHPLQLCLTHPSFLFVSLVPDLPCCPLLLLRPGPSFQSGPGGVYQVPVPEIHNPEPPPQQH